MANLGLFDKSGVWIEPTPEALAALTDPERGAVARIRDAEKLLDAANIAAEENGDKLADVRREIAALEKIVPKVTFNMLAKQMAADTQRRRAGL